MPRKSPYNIVLSEAEKDHLEKIARKYTSPYYREVIRAKIVLLAARGLPNDIIATRLDTPRQIISTWRKRFFEYRLQGLLELPRKGRSATFSPSGGSAGKSIGM